MGENEVIADLSDIRLLLCDLLYENKVTDETFKKILFRIDSKMNKCRGKEVIINGKS